MAAAQRQSKERPYALHTPERGAPPMAESPKLGPGERWFAWEGMEMAIPRDWDPAALHKGYLRIEDASRTTLELRWRVSPAGKSIQDIAGSYVARLEAELGGRPLAGLNAEELSPLPSRYEIAPFAVETGDTVFHGAALRCPECRRIVFLQTGTPRGEEEIATPDAWLRVLASFRDYHAPDWIPWSLFDIRAEIPGGFRLHSHSFQPGYFRMTFRQGLRWLALHRWAPADVLMRRISLIEWAAAQYRRETERRFRTPRIRTFNEFSAVEIVPKDAQGVIQRLSRALLRPESFRALMWHNAETNRILGVEMTGGGRAWLPLFYEVAGRFTILKGK